MADPTPAEVQRYIAQGLACEHVEVEGDGRHFFATIVSAEFEGASRVKRHQRVYQALADNTGPYEPYFRLVQAIEGLSLIHISEPTRPY